MLSELARVDRAGPTDVCVSSSSSPVKGSIVQLLTSVSLSHHIPDCGHLFGDQSHSFPDVGVHEIQTKMIICSHVCMKVNVQVLHNSI